MNNLYAGFNRYNAGGSLINHTLVVKDVVNLSFLSYKDTPEFIHGIVVVYDRVIREELFNTRRNTGGPFLLKMIILQILLSVLILSLMY